MAETFSRPRFGQVREPKTPVNPGRGLASAIDFITAGRIRPVLFLAVVGFLFFLPGFFNIPPIDRDEARFANLDDLTARMHLDSIEARRILSESTSTLRELA